MTSVDVLTRHGISVSDAASILNFEQAVLATFANDNQSIRAGETYIFDAKSKAPDAYFSFFCALVSFSSSVAVREFSAVMLRQSFKPGAEIMEIIAPETIHRVLQVVTHLFKTEPELRMRKQSCYLIGALSSILASYAFDEKMNPTIRADWHAKYKSIFQMLLECSQMKGNEDLRFTVLLAIAAITELVNSNALQEYMTFLLSVLTEGLKEKDPQKSRIRLVSLLGITSLLCNMEPEEKAQLQQSIPLMFDCLAQAFAAKDHEVIRDTIEVLMALAKLETKFLKSFITPIIQCMMQILGQQDMEAETKRSAMEFLIALAESGSGMIRKQKEFAQGVIPYALAFVLEIEHDETEWAKGTTLEEENEEEETGDNYQFGLQSIERLASALGGNVFLSVVQPILQSWIQSKRWEERHATLMSWAKMCDGCEREMKKHLRQILPIILQSALKDEHIRVRYAACYCIAFMSRSYAPVFQEDNCHIVVQTLLEMMNSNNHPRLIGQAALTMVDFVNAEGYEMTVLGEFARPILQAVVQLLNFNNMNVRESALRCLSAIALAVGEKFREFYASFLPGVKYIVFNAIEPEQKQLRGKAMEALGIMAEAVGPQMFGNEFPEVMELLVRLYTSKTISSADPEYGHLVESFARLARCMESALAPYLSAIVPMLLESAALEAFIVLDNSDDSAEKTKERADRGFESVSVSLRFMGVKRLAVNAFQVEEKGVACKVLYELALHLKEDYFPYVEQSAKVLVPNVTCFYDEKVRLAAVLTLPELVDSTVKYAAKLADDDSKKNAYVPALWGFMFPALITCLTSVAHLDGLICALEAFADCVLHLNIPLNEDQVNDLNDSLYKLLKDCEDRYQQRVEQSQEEDFDEVSKTTLEEENQQEASFLGYIYVLIAKVLGKNGASYVPSFHRKLYPLFENYLGLNNTSFQDVAICTLSQIVDDVAHPQTQLFPADENVTRVCASYAQKVFPTAMLCAKSKDTDLRQSSVFAIGACAAAAGHSFGEVLSPALKTLIEVIEADRSRDEENDRATDNAISALGKIMKYCSTALKGKDLEDPAALMQRWLSYLPCEGDEAEACVVHTLLCDFIEGNHPCIFGVDNSNLPAIFAIISIVLGTPNVTEDTARRMVHIIKTISASLNETLFGQLLNGLEGDSRENLQKWLNEPLR